MNLVVLMPTRGRPEKALQAWRTFENLKANDATTILWVVDAGDPLYGTYRDLAGQHGVGMLSYLGNMVQRTNEAALYVDFIFQIIGWAADDQHVRTRGWDDLVINEFVLRNAGMVQTNDLHYGPDKAANIFIRSDIVRALGYLALPTVNHLYVDDAWVTLGKLSESLIYLPDVHIEHMHPVYEKGAWDDQYRLVNDPSLYTKDYEAYVKWLDGDILTDVEKVKACLRS